MPTVPDVTDATVFEAALAYAAAGWYVLPVRTGKHPGSFVGRDWPSKSTRDEDRIGALFTVRGEPRAGIGIALHVGRSGALAFDVDADAHLSLVLAQCLARLTTPPMSVPYQMTRGPDVVRGHFLFSLPDGVMFGNGLGSLRTDPPWGDVRGRAGVVIAAPSPHASGGRYVWRTIGQLPELPKELGRALRTPDTFRQPPDVVRHPDLYVQASLDGIEKALRKAETGNRNNLLFWAACCVGELHARSGLDLPGVTGDLIEIAVERGLARREAIATVDSGIRTGSWLVTS